MSWQFVLHPRADKQLSDLSAEIDERIQNKLKEMVTNEWRDLMDYDVDTVSGFSHDIYRTRIGGYRIFFLVDHPIAAILHVDDREGAYRNLSVLESRANDFYN